MITFFPNNFKRTSVAALTPQPGVPCIGQVLDVAVAWVLTMGPSQDEKCWSQAFESELWNYISTGTIYSFWVLKTTNELSKPPMLWN